jgi:hypothetical protein
MLTMHCMLWVNVAATLALWTVFSLWMLMVMLFVLHAVMHCATMLALGAATVFTFFRFMRRWRITTSVCIMNGSISISFAVCAVLIRLTFMCLHGLVP